MPKGPAFSSLMLTGALFALGGCGSALAEAAEPVTIADYDYEQHEAAADAARWTIEIHSGAGIPGTPGAQDYYREPKRVLQTIVDVCELGSALYQQATDGVSILIILDATLTEQQIACVRSAEENSIRLRDRGPR